MDKLLELFSTILNVPKDSINLKTKKNDLEEWDSLAHIQLILEIEQFYEIQIPFEEAAEIKEIGDFLKFIEE